MSLSIFYATGVGMLSFNKRLGCFDSERTPEIVDHMHHFCKFMQISLTMPIKTFKYFRTPLYKQLEKKQKWICQVRIVGLTIVYILAKQ